MLRAESPLLNLGRSATHIHTHAFRVAPCAAALLGLSVVLAATGRAAPAQTPTPSVVRVLRAALRDPMSSAVDTSTRVAAAPVALGPGPAHAVVVYLTGRGWCGSGGCTTLVLAPAGDSYRAAGRIPVTQPPISVLPSTHHGWADLGVWFRDARGAREAVLRYDGRRYRGNPSRAPVARTVGRVVLDTAVASARLYP